MLPSCQRPSQRTQNGMRARVASRRSTRGSSATDHEDQLRGSSIPNSRESLTRAHARRLAVYGPFIPGPSGHATVTSRVVVGVDPRGHMAGIATWCGDTYLGHELVVRHGRGIIPDSAYLHQVCERIACWLAALPEGQVLLAVEGVHEPGRPARRRRKGTEGGLRYHRALAPTAI
jgi:hypothetical protein